MQKSKCFFCLETGVDSQGNNGDVRGKLLSLVKLVESSVSITDKDEISFCGGCQELLVTFHNLQKKMILSVNEICELMIGHEKFARGVVGGLRRDIIVKSISWLQKIGGTDSQNISELNYSSPPPPEESPSMETASTQIGVSMAAVKEEPPEWESDQSQEVETRSSGSTLRDQGNTVMSTPPGELNATTNAGVTMADVKTELMDSEPDTAAGAEGNLSGLPLTQTQPDSDPHFEAGRVVLKLESPFKGNFCFIHGDSPTPATAEGTCSTSVPPQNLNSSFATAASTDPTRSRDYAIVAKKRNKNGTFQYKYRCFVCNIVCCSIWHHRRNKGHLEKLSSANIARGEVSKAGTRKKSRKSKATVPKIVKVASQKTSTNPASASLSQTSGNKNASKRLPLPDFIVWQGKAFNKKNVGYDLYHCNECNEDFQSYRLTYHKRKHGIGRLECSSPNCSETFAVRSSQKAHERKCIFMLGRA